MEMVYSQALNMIMTEMVCLMTPTKTVYGIILIKINYNLYENPILQTFDRRSTLPTIGILFFSNRDISFEFNPLSYLMSAFKGPKCNRIPYNGVPQSVFC